MKIVLFLLAIIVLLWLLRGSFGRRGGAAPAARKPAGEPQAIVACMHCGVHLPRDEALPGRGGVFCGDAHRDAFEKAHPQNP